MSPETFSNIGARHRNAAGSPDAAGRAAWYRAYATDLEETSIAYVTAADAPGLARRARAYLYAESVRLHREAMAYYGIADGRDAADMFHEAAAS